MINAHEELLADKMKEVLSPVAIIFQLGYLLKYCLRTN